MLSNLSYNSSLKMICHMIHVEFPAKIKGQKIYEAIPHKTRNKHSDWSKKHPCAILIFLKEDGFVLYD